MAELKLGQVDNEITLPKVGRQLFETDIEIGLEDRTISGLLREDIVCKKKLFRIQYDAINGPDLEAIIDLYDLGEHLNFIVKDRDDSTRSYTVKFRPFNRRRWRVISDWWWRGVDLELEEV